MNRTDELTDRLIDGILTDAEAVELDSLLAPDPTAQARHLAAVRLELVLRGLRSEFDLAGPTVAKIETDRAERTTAAVMAMLPHRPVPGRPGRGTRLRVGVASLAAALLVAVWVGTRSPDASRVPDEPAVAASDFARLTAVTGSVEVVGPVGETAARPHQKIARDQTLLTVGEESAAVLEFPDRTRVEVHPDSVVRFGPEPAGGDSRKLTLVQGRITATAVGSRLVVGAWATEVEATGGSFSLWSAGSGSARVEPMDGDVRVSHGGPAEPVVLGPGRAAYVRDQQTPVRIEAPGRFDAVPLHRLNFPALDVKFTPDGEVLAVTAKQWVRWRPGGADPERVLFPPTVFNDGPIAWMTPDRHAVVTCRVDDKVEQTVIRRLPSGDVVATLPVRGSEPRFLCAAPDAAWVAMTHRHGPANRQFRVWEVATGAERFARDIPDNAGCVVSSPDGRWVVVGVSDLGKGTLNQIAAFDARTGSPVFSLPTRRKSVLSVAFTADGRTLAAGFNGAVQVWNVPERKLVRTLEGFERVVSRLAFSPNGDRLAAGTQDGQVWVWSTATGRRTQVIETGTRGVRSLAFSADGKLLVTATNQAPVAVWEVAPEPPSTSKPDV